MPLNSANNTIIRPSRAAGNAFRGNGFYTLQTPMEHRDEDLTFLATTWEPNCNYHVNKHFVGYSTIQLMTTGGVKLRYDDQEFLLEGAWFWPHHPGPRIEFYPAPEYSTWFHRHVGFCGSRVERWVESGLWPQSPQPAPPGRDWGAFFDELIEHAEHLDRWGYLRAVNMLECLLLDLAEARAQPQEMHEEWLLRVTHALQSNAEFRPDYARIAADAGMTPSTLRRRFRLALGMTMQEYMLQCRLSAARRLLVETDMPLKALAEHLGYDTVYFFARQFRQRVGVTPGLYRRSRQGKPPPSFPIVR